MLAREKFYEEMACSGIVAARTYAYYNFGADGVKTFDQKLKKWRLKNSKLPWEVPLKDRKLDTYLDHVSKFMDKYSGGLEKEMTSVANTYKNKHLSVKPTSTATPTAPR